MLNAVPRKPVRVVIDMPPSPAALAALEGAPEYDLRFTEQPEETERRLPPELLADADALFCSTLPSNHADLLALRWVQIGSVGYSQLYGKGMAERGVCCTNAAGVQDRPIAEWNVAMMINLRRRAHVMLRNQERRLWDRDAAFQREISGLTVGLWGYGGIGQQTARLAKALGLGVRALTLDGKLENRAGFYRVADTGDPDGRFVDRLFSPGQKAEFLDGLDFLILAIPLTPRTEGIVGAKELACLPPTAFVLNPARGPLIREEALVDALRAGVIAGAALDTHYQYPLPPDHPLWGMENVILTPHISGSSRGNHFLARIWDVFSQNLRRFACGQPLLNQLAPEQLNVS